MIAAPLISKLLRGLNCRFLLTSGAFGCYSFNSIFLQIFPTDKHTSKPKIQRIERGGEPVFPVFPAVVAFPSA
jgi:hypothetical protein